MSVPDVYPAILGLNMVESSSIMDIPNGHVANQSVHIITSERNTTICIPQASSGKKCWFSKLLIKSVDHRVFLIVPHDFAADSNICCKEVPDWCWCFLDLSEQFQAKTVKTLPATKAWHWCTLVSTLWVAVRRQNLNPRVCRALDGRMVLKTV